MTTPSIAVPAKPTKVADPDWVAPSNDPNATAPLVYNDADLELWKSEMKTVQTF